MEKDKSANLFKKFFGREPKSEFTIELGEMKNLTWLGKVNAIEYVARKHEDKQQVTYRHTFKKKPFLLTNGKEIIIFGDFEINERGIV